jgi:MFS transporter, DHA1 family, multidrug resistance protein
MIEYLNRIMVLPCISLQTEKCETISQATMNSHFHDTVFGQAVRLLSRNRLLKFPDELDPILWKQIVQKDRTAASSIETFGEHDGLAGSRDHPATDMSDGGERGLKRGAGMTSAHGSGGRQTLHQSHPGCEKTTGVRLVDWYGPDDPEV